MKMDNMKNNLEEQFKRSGAELRVQPSPQAWEKLSNKLNAPVQTATYRVLFKKISIAAAIALLALNAVSLMLFVRNNTNSIGAQQMVFMEIPESPNERPNIIPVSNFDQVFISEGDKSKSLVSSTYKPQARNLSNYFTNPIGIWSSDNGIFLNIFDTATDEILLSIEDENHDKLVLKIRQSGNEFAIVKKKGMVWEIPIRSVETKDNSIILSGDQGNIRIQQTDVHTIKLDIEIGILETTKQRYFLYKTV